MRVMDLVKRNIRPRDIVTRGAVENAIAVDMALGCSTNTTLAPARHLPLKPVWTSTCPSSTK